MPRILEKTERRLGEKLFIKGERCLGPKCAMVRRKYPPGMHGKKFRKKQSPFGFKELLSEKQKIRFLYGLDDKDIARYSKEAAKNGIFGDKLMRLLEARLDNVLFRLGVVESRRFARQIVSHGHVVVNQKTVRSPSYQVHKGDRIHLKDRITRSPLVASRVLQMKKYHPPSWLTLQLEEDRIRGEVLSLPGEQDIGITLDPAKVKEFYLR